MTNWGHLIEGIITEIAKRVPTYDDFDAIRVINRHWRSSLAGIQYSPTVAQVPWLMLAPDENDIIINDDGEAVEQRRFYNLNNGRVRRITLPEQIGKRRCLSSRGWLLTVSRHRSITLLNPFSGRVIYPPYFYLDDGCDWRFVIEKFALSCSPSFKDKEEEEYTMMISHGGYLHLAVWSSGASDWTETDFKYVIDVIYSDELFYAITYDYKVSAYSVEPFWDGTVCRKSHRVCRQFFVDMGSSFSSNKSCKNYLVWSQGKLFAISRDYDDGPEDDVDLENHVDLTSKVWMAELTVQTTEVITIKDLGNRSLFVGSNESFALEGIEGCMPNCIYFTDDDDIRWPSKGPGGRNMDIFNLMNKNFKSFNSGESLSIITPPLWVECRRRH